MQAPLARINNRMEKSGNNSMTEHLTHSPRIYARYNIVGTSGCGKTTFARRLAAIVQKPCVEMDVLYWGREWQKPSDSDLRAKVELALKDEEWVLDGNYKSLSDIKWRREVCVVWLDYSFPRVFLQALKRALHRAWTKQELWPDTNCREDFRTLLFSKKSILLWTVQTFRSNRTYYSKILSDERYAHVHIVRVRSREQAEQFLAGLSARC